MRPTLFSVRAACAAFAVFSLSGCGGSDHPAALVSTPTTPVTTPGAPPSPPSVPAGAVSLALTPGSGGGCVTLAWSATGLSSPTFDVLRTLQNTTTTLLSRTAQTSFVDVGLTPGIAYAYQIIAHGNDNSQKSSLAQQVTPFGPATPGLSGTPAAPDVLYRTANLALVTSFSRTDAASNYFTLSLTLNRAAKASDLQSVLYQQTSYDATSAANFAKGITVTGNTLTFDSRLAGITLDPTFRPVVKGGFYTLTTTVAGKPFQMTGLAGVTNALPNPITIVDSTGRSFTFTVTNNS